jgi:hypothetical protein
MSADEGELLAVEGAHVNGQPQPGSFEARMQERRVQREQRTTELFEPPGFEDIFRVEMQVVGFKPLSEIALRHQRQRDDGMRALAIAAEQIMLATVGFHMVRDDGTTAEAEGDPTWLDMARAYDPNLGPDTRERVAVIRLLEGPGVLALNNDWFEWNTRGNQQVDKELAADFSTT